MKKWSGTAFFTWLRYFLYFLCPLLVLFIVWVLFAISDGLFSVADRGATIVLGILILLAAGGIAFFVSRGSCKPEKYLFRVSSDRQKKQVAERLQQILNDELPAKKKAEPMGSLLYDGSYAIFLGMNERVVVEDVGTGIQIEAPQKLMALLKNEVAEIDPLLIY